MNETERAECTGDRRCKAPAHIEGCFATEAAYEGLSSGPSNDRRLAEIARSRTLFERDVYQAGWAHGYRERPGAKAERTPDREKGMWRKRGDTLLSECVYLMEQMFMESLNGVLCQYEDERCAGCQKMWAELKALMDRYDAGER
jgi:hypothetical protein